MSAKNGTAVAERPATGADAVEVALVQGDLARLSVDQRLAHYLRVCQSMGLNPHTSPFDYIVLNGKTRLYAKKDCTDQLRKINGVSVVGEPVKRIDDGILTVTIRMRDATGREDADEGAVSIAGLKGDALANAHMKAMTKAKRRATLSICGLGWLDETEVEAIPAQQPTAHVSAPVDERKELRRRLALNIKAAADAQVFSNDVYAGMLAKLNAKKTDDLDADGLRRLADMVGALVAAKHNTPVPPPAVAPEDYAGDGEPEQQQMGDAYEGDLGKPEAMQDRR